MSSGTWGSFAVLEHVQHTLDAPLEPAVPSGVGFLQTITWLTPCLIEVSAQSYLLKVMEQY